MSEQNEQTPKPTPPKELCTLRLIFPVVSDEQAIEVKSKCRLLLVDIPDAQIHFAIVPMPSVPSMPMR